MTQHLFSNDSVITRTKFRWQNRLNALTAADSTQRLFELGLSLLVGVIAGITLIFSFGWSSSWQGIVLIVPIAFVLVMLADNPERLMLAALAVSVPLNLDISLVTSPFARNVHNLAMGNRTLVTLTELRLSLVTILLLIGYGLWFVSARRRPVRFYAANTVPALGLIFLSLVSLFQAQDLQLASFRVVQLFELFLMYFYLINHLRTIKDFQFFLTISMLAMFVESILMIVQWNTGFEFSFAGIQATMSPSRVAGTLGSEGPAGGYLSAHAIIALAAIWVFPRKSWQRMLAAACVITGVPALISTGSRAGWLGFSVTLLIFILVTFWRGWVSRKKLALMFLAILVIGAFFYQPIHTRLTEDDRGSAESRFKMNRLAWNVIEANIWFGVGANNYALVAQDYYTSDVGELGYVINSIVHNRYLAIWAEIGLFGLLFYLAFLGIPLTQSFLYVVRPHSSRLINLAMLGLGCAVFSLGIQMLTGTFHIRTITIFVWLVPGMLASLRGIAQDSSLFPEPGEITDRSYPTQLTNLAPTAAARYKQNKLESIAKPIH